MEHIRNIIFDFGTILINLDYERTFNAFEDLGFKDMKTLFAYGNQQHFFDQLETGHIDDAAFFNYIRTLAQKPLSDTAIAHAWNAMLLDFPPHRLEMLKNLKQKGYRLFLLSNTNNVHKIHFSAQLKAQYGFDVFEELFEKAHFSNEIGMRKPDSKIYEHVLNTHHLKPAETIFIDDIEENLLPAKALGIMTCHVPKGEEVCDVFSPALN